MWRLHSERQLRDLGRTLNDSSWTPSAWIQVPYPKKGARLRHFVSPTVRDQVAFMTHMVLLGPLIDSELESFVFGNRWYRPRRWDREEKCWRSLPYPLITDQSYLPYAREHSLFRRVTNWTVSRMTGSAIEEIDDRGRAQSPSDYADGFLPRWTKTDWWRGSEEGPAHWAALDLEIAYPSVRVPILRQAILEILAIRSFDALNCLDYPSSVITVLRDPDARSTLAERLMEALLAVTLRPTQIEQTSWKAPHARAKTGRDGDLGIPTGLAISGVLLNAALTPADRRLRSYLGRTHGENRGAIVRFADDMYVLSRSPRGMLALVEAVCRAVADSVRARVADATWTASSNLYLNFDKIRPEKVKETIFAVRRQYGWTDCSDCDSLRPPTTAQRAATLDSWWENTCAKDSTLGKEMSNSAVNAGEVGPFVTNLVETMSEIGRDLLSDRFGGGARARLRRLHELARFDIHDEQVRSETRKMFAATRLATAWLPNDGRSTAADVEDIRTSVQDVLGSTPWKFSLWKTVVRVASRRPLEQERSAKVARSWLKKQLRRVASIHVADAESWSDVWPEKTDNHSRGRGWRDLYLSYHRAAFWQALRNVLSDLWKEVDRSSDPAIDGVGRRPERWTTRAIPSDQVREIADFLGETDEWVATLYGGEEQDYSVLGNRPWELDQLVCAVLASARRLDVAEAYAYSVARVPSLCVPLSLTGLGNATRRLLECVGRVHERHPISRGLTVHDLAHVAVAGADRRLGQKLFPSGRAPRIEGWKQDPCAAVAIGVALGCSRDIGADLARSSVPEPPVAATGSEGRLWLSEYAAARRVLLGQSTF